MTHVADDRGRRAARPTDIPRTGLLDVLHRVKDEVSEDRVTMVAGGVTFYLLLALVPGLTALVSIYGLVADPEAVQAHLERFVAVVPGGGMDILRDQLERITSQERGSLGFAFALSLAISLWSANAGVKAMFEAMNIAYDEREKRSFIRLNLVSLTFTIALIVAVIAVMILVVVLPVVLDALGFGVLGQWASRIGGFVLLAILAVGSLAALYRFGPSRARAEWRWITPGAILSLVVWLAASALFTWYAANLGSYNATYGSLGSVIGFLFWIWISTIIVIVGAELNAELEHQTALDTTEGEDRPMGRRGAAVADTLGRTRA